ncbi:MAG: glucose-6-phosphate isomerase [Candidatus Diapherotrites archaeon]|nr:glucose-6-phosphate isomerase [Candidatus Diapherotrites archaeon]
MPEFIDLKSVSGLPLALDGSKLVFKEGIRPVHPDIRTLSQMKPVLRDPDAKPVSSELYFMYRDVCLEAHRSAIAAQNLRYDVTILPPVMLGLEFNKTFGHFHPLNPAGAYYPELYEVLFGEAVYLLQHLDGSRFVSVHAKAGDKVLMPPGYGHITVNPSDKNPLVMSNWVERNFKSDYGPIREKQGGMYYLTPKGFEENHQYGLVPEVVEHNVPSLKKLGVPAGPMYPWGTQNLSKLEWLAEPEKYAKELDVLELDDAEKGF